MRKIITFSIFILVFSVFSGTVLAGDKSECDKDKDALKELKAYGLCVAYYNADEEDKPKLAQKFKDRTGFDVPGTDSIACPCWDAEAMAEASAFGNPNSCLESIDGITGEFAIYDDLFPDDNGYQFVIDPGFCWHISPSNGGYGFPNPDEDAACRDDVQALMLLDFEGVVCDGT